jgi:hypothetical protein
MWKLIKHSSGRIGVECCEQSETMFSLKKVDISPLRSRKPRLTTVGIRCADHVTPSTRKSQHYFADSGSRSVGIVRLRTKATEFSLVFRIFLLSTHLLIWVSRILWGRHAQTVGTTSLWHLKFSWWCLEFFCIYIISAWSIVDYGKIVSFFLSHLYLPSSLFLLCYFLSLFICPFYCHSSPLSFLFLLQVKIVLLPLFFQFSIPLPPTFPSPITPSIPFICTSCRHSYPYILGPVCWVFPKCIRNW